MLGRILQAPCDMLREANLACKYLSHWRIRPYSTYKLAWAVSEGFGTVDLQLQSAT